MNLASPPRVVLDTNLLVGAAYAPHSASGRLLGMAERGGIVWVVSPAVFGEYRVIVPKAVRRAGGVDRVLSALRHAVAVVPTAAHDRRARRRDGRGRPHHAPGAARAQSRTQSPGRRHGTPR